MHPRGSTLLSSIVPAVVPTVAPSVVLPCVLGCVLGCAGALAARAAHAQAWPAKPLRIVVPFPPGGPNDIIGRLVGQKLAEAFGQPVVADNRAGAGGSIGSLAVAKSPPDGYTLLSGGMGNLVMNPIIDKVPYDTLRDFAPVSLVASAPNVLVVHPSLPAKDVKSLLALARSRPGELNYGSGGVGSTPHLSGALFNVLGKVNLAHVPYKGNAPALTDLLGGHVQAAFLGIPAAQPPVASGRLRALAVTGSARSRALPQVPTVAESGLPSYELSPWYGILAPAGTPADVVARLNETINRSMREPDMVERLAALGAEPESMSAAEYAARIRADIEKWTRVIRAANIRAE
ncbi:MAG: tripartite tricarboxylate transporter substrate binding protein [Betaproteobacteria bacterium]|jgi:tripartite-type tricarboxylate transporter receptor subunit TctC|nr:tripartite tricarboxylate transporter substrate binding protein [Betaproteobacteria bacterium]